MTSQIPHPAQLPLDFDACYRAISGRDTRWDGRVYLGVTSTGIYCRPSCPARKPAAANCRFFASAAACVAAGFRACKRCRPEAMPGTRDWDIREDLAARAVRRIRDGAIDSAGVGGLAHELAVSERHLHRVLVDEVGASPLQLARSRRAHAARTLIEQTTLPLSDIAFAAGFGSLRQFGDTMREEFGVTPSALPRHADKTAKESTQGGSLSPTGGPSSDERPSLTLQLRTRAPFDVAGIRAFLSAHAIPGRDQISGTHSAHAVDVPGGTAVARIDWSATHEHRGHVLIPLQLALPGLSDTMPAIASIRRMLDLDADPTQISETLGNDPLLAQMIAARPGLRLPGTRNPQEFALGTVLGQQVSLAAARTLQGRLASLFASENPVAAEGFVAAPDVLAVAKTPIVQLREKIGLTEARANTLRAVAAALSEGLNLGHGGDRELARRELLAIRGIGPWSVELIAMRALGDPDAYPAGDLILKKALGTKTERETTLAAEGWRPYRGYATQHLWADFLAAQAERQAR
ncbi:Ada metal-binding domain-containing protein [Leucobacter sp. UT-8R-CII-1-4]|uniref:DNA-3-methyladenine glycosylase 2 family protein n=1 Tax=Leucobacter sp. UT-8R-CII-1-4 TaxID=3040075 RepID=UPI0024A8C9F8|nr:Ada metal-binding domain-containing protein [Leucobacter sp. UT-8R-CII-1-4]MDI6022260.1 Ada metal-binding domain-containing protein [Leucobacter sp. UT-8R-CII-1-4]